MYIVKNLTQQLIYYSAAVVSGNVNKDYIEKNKNKEKLKVSTPKMEQKCLNCVCRIANKTSKVILMDWGDLPLS